ncbi:NADH-cytochrome b5 reductase 2 [Ramicandelaber brevisporus]|nr:NADH-cytochrome b5 reductase 2 [Ramicandelaber brevisporus]
MDPKTFVKFKLSQKTPVNHNTALFRFALASASSTLALPVASCILIKFTAPGGETVIRPYTPTSDETARGYFDLVIKSYTYEGGHPSGIKGGSASQYMHSLKVGDEVEIKGPIKKLQFTRNAFEQVGMVAGGTGITPIVQVFRKILNDPEDVTKLSLVYCNHTERDILLKESLDKMAKENPERVKIHYKITKPDDPKSWKGGVGHVSEKDIQKYLPSSSLGERVLIGVCGPPGFMDAVSGDKLPDKSQGPLSGMLSRLGYVASQVFKF